MENLYVLFLPAFVICLAAEILYSSFAHLELHQRKDTLANLSLGIFALIIGTFMKAISFVTFSAIHQVAIVEMPVNTLSIVLCFLASDFVYYIFHRVGHEVRIFWAAHETHHSSKKYNFSTALRLPLSLWYRFLFWAPLALFFDPALILFLDSAAQVYQFFLHTELVGKLGPLEWIFNTPSHHRVHHSSNPEYIDKNYGAVLIVWDRLFGTFAVEKSKPVYGITKDFETGNPAKIAIHGWVDALGRAFQQNSLARALRFLVQKPD